MLPIFILPESVHREDGVSPEIELGAARGKAVLVTLGITRIVEQQSLDVSIWGSPEKQNWGTKALAIFPQKFYCGTYTLLLDLSEHPDIQYLRAQWKMSRWGRGDPKPLFGFYLFAQEAALPALAQAGG